MSNTTTDGGPSCLVGTTYCGHKYIQSSWTYHDVTGATDLFSGSTTRYVGSPANCPSDTSMTASVDGWTMTATGGALNKLSSISGQLVAPPLNTTSGAASKTDANGNKVGVDNSGQFFDTLSSTTPVLTASGSGTPSSPWKFGYIPPANESSGTRVYMTVNSVNYTVKTGFGARDNNGNSIGEYTSTSAVSLVDNIALPNDTSTDHHRYTFTYESTPGTCTPLTGTSACVTGRIVQITLPTGGT